MKLLIQCNYDPDNLGGIERVTLNLLDVLKSRDIEVEVIAGSASGTVQKRDGYLYRGLEIMRKIDGTPLLRFGNLQFLRAGMRADLIVFQEPFPTLLPGLFLLRFLLRKQVVVLVHAIPHMPKPVAGLYDRVRRALLSRVAVVATTPVLRDQLRLTGSASRQVIPLCFDETAAEIQTHLSEAEAAQMPSLPERYMLFFGRLAGYKGLEVLLPAIRDLPHIEFVIAGSGIKGAYVENYIAEYGLTNVIFIHRHVSEKEKYHLIRHCAAFLLPSTNKSEAFAITQLEAMFYSRPVVNTQLSNGVNYVAPDNVAALTVPVNSVDALSIAIQQLWDDPMLAGKLGKGGKNRMDDLFSREAFQSAWGQYFDTYLTGS